LIELSIISVWVKVVIFIVWDRTSTMWRYLVHNRPTLKSLVALACVWQIINLHGLICHNKDIFSLIDGIMSNLNLTNIRAPFRQLRIEPVAFEHDKTKRFLFIKWKFIDIICGDV
jgi:hypothetical protein